MLPATPDDCVGRYGPREGPFTALTTATDRVVVTFCEPVSGPIGRWQVKGADAVLLSADGSSAPPLSVTGARTLVFRPASAVGEDERPDVAYAPLPAGGELRDGSTPGHVVAPADRVREAADGIRPAVPRITAVDGRAPSTARCSAGPRSRRSRWATSWPATPSWSSVGPPAGRRCPGPRCSLPGLGHRPGPAPALERPARAARRRPRRRRQPVVDTSKNAGRADKSPSQVTYVLDTNLPGVLFAVADDDDEVVVRPPAAGGRDTAAGGPRRLRRRAGNVHEANVNALSAAGVVQGTAPRRYEPLAPITWQQMAGFLVR